MACYPVYLESTESGLTMAHVLGLPGCTVRAASRDEALCRLPEAIRDYHAWLRRHGEPAPASEEPVEIEVAAESIGYGPFGPGNAAAIFAPDQQPVAPAEIEEHARLMAHSRADLLDLVRDLPDELLDWQSDPQSFSIRRVLRHIGNAEEWYVSRIVPPTSLPPEWEHDEDMPLFEFLDMERRTAIARLQQLTAEERSLTFQPACWTEHPEEPWTARKSLRRFLEHEREHAGQIREILAIRRRRMLAELAAERGRLLEQLICLDEKVLTETAVSEGWAPKDALAHLATWDRWVRREIGRLLAGETPETAAVKDINAYNAANVAAWRNRSLDEVVAELQEARSAWVAWMESLPVEEFFRRRRVGRSNWSPANWVHIFLEHDGEHAHQLEAWRKAQGLREKIGPRMVLLAALAGRREELLATVALVPPEERATRPVCGVWTLQDVLGHVADWEQWAVAGLRAMAAGRPHQIELVTDEGEEAWNQAHAAARRGQSWDAVWTDFQATRQALEEILEGMDQAGLTRTFPGVWDAETTPYAWFLVCLTHDREHASDLREAMIGAATAPAQAG